MKQTGKKMRVVVLMGGPSSEHDVSLVSGIAVCDSLDPLRYEVIPVVLSKMLAWQFPGQLFSDMGEALSYLQHQIDPDLVFIALHGYFGEDGRIQALLEAIGVPFTGSGVAASALAMDKDISARLFAASGLMIPHYVVVKNEVDIEITCSAVGLPCVVKPADGGSSIGVIIAKSMDELRSGVANALKLSDRVIIQTFVAGTEITCGVLERGGIAEALPPTEIVVPTFFDYESKYKVGLAEEITPARMTPEVIGSIQEVALKTHEILGCSGWSRTDMIVTEDGIYVLEINTIPGLTPNSLLPKQAKAAGIEFPQLLERIIAARCPVISQS